MFSQAATDDDPAGIHWSKEYKSRERDTGQDDFLRCTILRLARQEFFRNNLAGYDIILEICCFHGNCIVTRIFF